MKRNLLAVLCCLNCFACSISIHQIAFAQAAAIQLDSQKPDDVLQQKVALLIDQLNAKSYRQREQATADLIDVGMPAIRQVALAMLDRVPEQSFRCAYILKQVADSTDIESQLEIIRIMDVLTKSDFPLIDAYKIETVRKFESARTEIVVNNLAAAGIDVRRIASNFCFDQQKNELWLSQLAEIADDLEAARDPMSDDHDEEPEEAVGRVDAVRDEARERLLRDIAADLASARTGMIVEESVNHNHQEDLGSNFQELDDEMDVRQLGQENENDASINLNKLSVSPSHQSAGSPDKKQSTKTTSGSVADGATIKTLTKDQARNEIDRIISDRAQRDDTTIFKIAQLVSPSQDCWDGLSAKSIVVARWLPEFHFAAIELNRQTDLQKVVSENENSIVDIAIAQHLRIDKESILDDASQWISRLECIRSITAKEIEVNARFLETIKTCDLLREIEFKNCQIDFTLLREFANSRPMLNVVLSGKNDFGISNPDRFANDHSAQKCTIRYIETGSIADKAGLRKGDTIVGINDTKINCYRDLVFDIAQRQAGENIDIILYRNGRKGKITTTLQPHTENKQTTGDDVQVVRPRQDFYMPK
jgi:hypothetical protein